MPREALERERPRGKNEGLKEFAKDWQDTPAGVKLLIGGALAGLVVLFLVKRQQQQQQSPLSANDFGYSLGAQGTVMAGAPTGSPIGIVPTPTPTPGTGGKPAMTPPWGLQPGPGIVRSLQGTTSQQTQSVPVGSITQTTMLPILQGVAQQQYGNPNLWTAVYTANRATLANTSTLGGITQLHVPRL